MIKFPHSVMFHHFHDNKKFNRTQGSLNQKNFLQVIDKIGIKNIISAQTFYEKMVNKKLTKNDVCLSFDDGLLCQYKIAYPVLKKLNIKAFWFIPSNIFERKPELLEIYSQFRNTKFTHIDDFYSVFFEDKLFQKNKKFNEFAKNNTTKIRSLNKKFPFYSYNDLFFRMIRDNFLDKENYQKIMHRLMTKYMYDYKKEIKNYLLSKKNLIEMSKDKQVIGLHSHTHPTNILNLKKIDQTKEYKKNFTILQKISKEKIFSMSHPCGNYNQSILNNLKKMGIKIGFRSNMKTEKNNKINKSNLEIAREDHANIFKKISS